MTQTAQSQSGSNVIIFRKQIVMFYNWDIVLILTQEYQIKQRFGIAEIGYFVNTEVLVNNKTNNITI